MKELFNFLKTRIDSLKGEDGLSVFKFIHIWNNQVHWMVDNSVEYDFAKPAIFIEFVNTEQVDVIGGGIQQFDPLDINFHIVTDFYDATDGTLEQNLYIFELKQLLYSLLQTWHCDGSGPFNRVSETHDYDHPNIYHFIQMYRTTWTDITGQLPIGGYYIDPPLTTTITPVVLPQLTL